MLLTLFYFAATVATHECDSWTIDENWWTAHRSTWNGNVKKTDSASITDSKNKKLRYRRDNARSVNGHSRLLEVIRCCANRRGIYAFLLALNSNLTSISTVLEISHLVFIVYNLTYNSSVQPTSIEFTYALLLYHYYRLILCLICTSIPHLYSKWNWKNTADSRWTCFGVRVPRTLDYPTINLNPG